MGCYFHYTKSLWKKAKKEGFSKKNFFKETLIIIFAFKIYVFIPNWKKGEYLKEIDNFYKDKIEYISFIKYFKKNWSTCNFLNFEDCDQNQIIERTDNVCEHFHNNLKNMINIHHPKISYLIDKLKDCTISVYNNLIKDLVLENNISEKNFNVYDDVFEFLKKIKNKYK